MTRLARARPERRAHPMLRKVVSDDTLLLEAWAEWQDAHEPEFIAALREMDRGNASPMSVCLELAIIAAARKRMELLAGEARKAA